MQIAEANKEGTLQKDYQKLEQILENAKLQGTIDEIQSHALFHQYIEPLNALLNNVNEWEQEEQYASHTANQFSHLIEIIERKHFVLLDQEPKIFALILNDLTKLNPEDKQLKTLQIKLEQGEKPSSLLSTYLNETKWIHDLQTICDHQQQTYLRKANMAFSEKQIAIACFKRQYPLNLKELTLAMNQKKTSSTA